MFGRLHRSAESLLQCLRDDEVQQPYDVLHLDGGSAPPSTVQCSAFTQLPVRCRELLGGAEIACLLGVVPEVRRAWLTVDNRLFLWDYLAPDQTFESCVIEVPIEISSDFIVGASIVRPKSGVFVDGVNFLMAVVTTAEVVLLALAYDAGSNALAVSATPYVVDTESIMMLSVTGAPDGRIFMGGSDGNLYELCYDDSASPDATSGGWTVAALFAAADAPGQRAKCRKVKHLVWRWRMVHFLLPPFLVRSLGGGDNSVCLQYLCVDASRCLLYACTKSSNLSAFSVAGGAAEALARDFVICDRAAAFSRGRGGAALGVLVGLHVARGGCLVAAFSSGALVHLALGSAGLQVVDVRSCSASAGGGSPPLAFSFYEDGTFLGCGSDGGRDGVLAVTLDGGPAGWREVFSTAVLPLPGPQGSGELACACVVDIKSSAGRTAGATLALLAACVKCPLPNGARVAADSSAARLTQYALQTYGCPQEHLLLSAAGLATLSRTWPVDPLARVLRSCTAPAASGEAAAMFAAHGAAQACAMCFLLAVSDSSEQALRHRAVRLAVHLGGQISSAVDASGAPALGTSAAHDGVYLLAARLLRPLWFAPVLDAGGPSALFSPKLGDALGSVLRPLRALCDEVILKEFASAFKARPPVVRPPAPGMTQKQLASCARAAEEASIFALHALLERLFQVVALIEILCSSDLLSAGPRAWAFLEGRPLRGWVCEAATVGALRSALVSSLAASGSGSEERLEDSMRRLRRDCGAYFSSGDHVSCLVMLRLHCCARGRSSEGVVELLLALLRCCVYWTCEGDVRGEHSTLAQSVALLLRVGGGDAVHAVAALYLATANTFGGCAAMEPALLSGQTALTLRIEAIEREAQARPDGTPAAEELDEAQRSALRRSIYGDLCSFLLRQPEPLMAQLARSIFESGAAQDEQLAELLCRRLHDEHLDVLLAMDAPAVEDFLEADPAALHQFYETHGRLREAAVFMDNLASTSADCPLETRIERFQMALHSALGYLQALRASEVGGAREEEEEEDSVEDMEAYVELLRSRLVTARYQQRLLRSLGSTGAGALRREEEAALLLRRVDDVYLFREVGLKYGQFDVCLLLLCAAPHLSEDPELVEKLARSLVYRLLPPRACSSGGPAEGAWREFLRQKADAALPVSEPSAAGGSLEDAGWAERLQARMAELGVELFFSAEMVGGSAERNFPLHVFVSELVDVCLALRRAHAAAPRQISPPSEGFAGSALSAMGVSSSTVAEGFLKCLGASRGCSLEKQCLLAQLCVLQLQRWVADAGGAARESLIEYIGSGRMEASCGAARSAINSLLSSLRTPQTCLADLRAADDTLSAVLARVDALVTTQR